MNFLSDIIKQEIIQRGPISFARFMELALYTPNLGYYEQQKQIGCRGDFYTSVSVGPLFGELLAFQFSEWLSVCLKNENPENRVQLLEAGAHSGELARDILKKISEFSPEIFETLEFWLLEPSIERQKWQHQTLAEFSGKIRWFRSWAEVPKIQGVIFSNELLDAMPVQRIGWSREKNCWFEWLVGWRNGDFAWEKSEVPITPDFQFPRELLEVLPDHFTTEISTAAPQWWRDAAHHLGAGKLLAIDYGLTEEEFFVPERMNGTLRAFSRHHLIDNLLKNVGQQDITAHVNFSALQKTGEQAGLKIETLTSQTRFLTQIAEKIWRNPSRVAQWDAPRIRQFQTLTHPEHLGRGFRVLVQNR
jgi:SAM-dependent MidA family methyltransferase